jgi:hypothetical protein
MESSPGAVISAQGSGLNSSIHSGENYLNTPDYAISIQQKSIQINYFTESFNSTGGVIFELPNFNGSLNYDFFGSSSSNQIEQASSFGIESYIYYAAGAGGALFLILSGAIIHCMIKRKKSTNTTSN